MCRVHVCMRLIIVLVGFIVICLIKCRSTPKVKNARMTVRLNGVVIHENLEINGKTGGSRRDPEGTAGPIKLQGHGNPVQFRNIWILEK